MDGSRLKRGPSLETRRRKTERNREIRKLCRKGIPVKEIAARTGLTANAVYGIIRDVKVPVSAKERRAVALWEKGVGSGSEFCGEGNRA